MLNTIRAESRSRRLPSSVDTTVVHQHHPSRARRVPSSSRIDLSLPQTPTVSTAPLTPAVFPDALLHSFCQTLSYFLLFYVLYSTPTSHLLFIAFPASVAAFFAVLATSHRSLPAFHFYFSRPSSRQVVLFTAGLYTYSILGTAQATVWLGPPRALIALAAYPSFSRLVATVAGISTRRSFSSTFFFRFVLAPVLLTLVAFLLLTHDATEGVIPPSSAKHVRQHVMHNPLARKVHSMVSNVLDRVPHSNRTRSLRSYSIPLRRKHHRRPNRLESNRSHYIASDGNANSKHQPISPHNPEQRRRTLSTKSDDLNSTDSNSTYPNRTTNQSTNDSFPGNINISQPHFLKKLSNDSAASKEEHEIDRNHTSADESPTINLDSEPLPLTTAAFAIFLAITAPLAHRIASDFSYRLIVEEANPAPFLLLVFSACAVISLTIFTSHGLFTVLPEELSFPEISFDMWWKGLLVGILFFFIPIAIRLNIYRRNISSLRVGFPSFPASRSSVFNVTTAVPSALILYPVALLAMFTMDRIGYSSESKEEELSFFSISSAFLLAIVAREEITSGPGRSRRDQSRRGAQSLEIPKAFSKRIFLYFRQNAKRVKGIVTSTGKAFTDLGSQARTNRASRQVLSFFMLQSGMAVSELIIATVTHTSGLFSISTDNLFCSLALATGFMAIRISAWKASTIYSYGYSRAESIGGFANGIMLVYVATLIVLEAQERSAMQGSSANGRAFLVCVLGIAGNSLGLYFFPPETRRENHNVEGIYLHIVANTLAFISMAVSTTTKAIAMPKWYVLDVGVVCAVGCGVVGFAVPQIVRSARLLLLMVSHEKGKRLERVKENLAGIPGVVRITGLRVWNLTPNSLVASVKLEAEKESSNVHNDILSNARSVFALMGVPPSQCTIQVSYLGINEKSMTTATATSLNGAIYFSVGESSKGE